MPRREVRGREGFSPFSAVGVMATGQNCSDAGRSKAYSSTTRPYTIVVKEVPMKKLFGLLGYAALLGLVIISMSYAAEPMAASSDTAAAGSKAVTGDLLKIDGEFYVVKDASGKEVRLHVDKTSKLEGTPKPGDKIEAQASEKGHALSIKPASAASGTSR